MQQYVVCYDRCLVATTDIQVWVAQISIKFRPELNLMCKLIISCTFQAMLNVN